MSQLRSQFEKSYESTSTTKSQESSKESCYIPVRFVLVLLLFLGTCVSYTLRTDINLTIVAMINKTKIRELEGDCSVPSDSWCLNATTTGSGNGKGVFDDSACPIPVGSDNSTLTSEEGSFVWKSETQGIILGSFFYGYASTQLLSGRLCDLLGPKWLIGGGVLFGSICTSLVPLVAPLGVVALVFLRVLTGMTQGCLYPGIVSLLNRWVPVQERTRMYCICNAGASVGIIITMPLVGFLCEQTAFAGGWPAVFYLFGATGAIWSILWMLLSSNDPKEHPRITFQERKYILENVPSVRDSAKKPDFPWMTVLTSVRVWSHIFTWVTSSFIFAMRITEMPNYLDQVLHFPIQQNGLINAIINLAPALSSVGGSYIADYVINNNKMSKTNTRKLFETLAQLGASGFLMLVTLSGCNHVAVISLLTLSGGMQGLANNGDAVLGMDYAPTFSGSIFGLANTFNSIGTFLCPSVVGFILGMNGVTLTNQWHYIFYLTSALCVLGTISALTLWSAEVQPWDPSVKVHQDEHLCHDSCGCDDDHLVVNEHHEKY